MKNSVYDKLQKKIESNNARIGVVGLGYVGLPLLCGVVEKGFKAHGFDIDQSKIDNLVSGESYLKHIKIDSLGKALNSGDCALSSGFEAAADCDAIILCVPTPLSSHREPDLTFIESSLAGLLPFLRAGQMLSLESTTYPGTTEEKLCPPLIDKGLSIGKDFFVVYSPEREDPGNTKFEFSTIPKVVSGITDLCADLAESLYGAIVGDTIRVSSTRTAEMTKILENTYRAVNIALVNELKILSDAMDIDIFEVINAAATKPFGYKAFYPGPGLGGHCIPIDPFYLTWKAKEYGLHTKFIELAGEINTSMPDYVIGKVSQGLNQMKKSVSEARILVVGVAYKKNVGDVRESPGVEIISILLKMGAKVDYFDPHVPSLPKMRQYNLEMQSIDKISADLMDSFDCCVIVTDHDDIDYRIIEKCRLIIDSRGRLKKSDCDNLIQA